jgi:NAD(P)H-dependent FMN reductase
MTNPLIAVVVGSDRRDAINRRLAQVRAGLGGGKFDAKFVRIDDLPMYSQDNEGAICRLRWCASRPGSRRPTAC